MSTDVNVSSDGQKDPVSTADTLSLVVRASGWAILGVLLIFLLNNYLTNWQDWPGVRSAFNGDASGLSFTQLALFPVGIALGVLYAFSTRWRGLREESAIISNINTVMIRMAFYAVLYVGLADAVVSFLRVEGLLPAVVGDKWATDLGISEIRGKFIHIPLIIAAIITGIFARTLGFHWLALLAVGAELLIVITRFVFSYEQAFMSDLVRFWYASLFLFASAYTLLEEGHVRVDVLYANFNSKAKGRANTIGSVLLGIVLCWVVLLIGMDGKSAIINSPMLAFETTQTGFGMYVKYLMAGFLAIFAISMMIQFVSYALESIADWRGEPGARDHDVHAVQ